mmetsp:Transcript_18641/g.44663  ORF Transcript_18641/g.44663 Transcript_18641/m.44663 type:complete len:342 (-) Transcript_18641:353-1378(-)
MPPTLIDPVASNLTSVASTLEDVEDNAGVAGGVAWLNFLYVLLAGYSLVMLLVFSSICFRRRLTTRQPDEMAEGMIEAQEQSATGFRRVKRGASALSSTGPGMDLSQIERSIKMGFLRKVYSILSTQLLVTVGVIVGFIYISFQVEGGTPNAREVTAFGDYITSNTWLILVALIPLLVILCCLHSFKNVYPINFVGLGLFTLLQSTTLGIVCVLYYERGYGEQILLAAGITLGIFLVLTAYTLQSKIDWSFCGAGLTAGLFVMIFWSWFTFWLLPSTSAFAWHRLISLFGALLFCGFIVYDTHMIMKHFGVDDYIIAAIELYLDVVNLFQYLLMLLSSSNN